MSDCSFYDVVSTYFQRRGYKIEKDVMLDGYSGLMRKFDLSVHKGNERRLVWVREWKRTVGVNMIINIDKASTDVGFPNPIIISEKFSGHAKAYANRRGITLIPKGTITRELG
jgi:hypothetical protein